MNNRDTEAAFQAIAANLKTSTPELEPTDDAVLAILDHFFSLIAAYGPIDMEDRDARYGLIHLLTEGMKNFFESFEPLTESDDVMVEGGTIVTMLDTEDGSIEASYLEEHCQLFGKIGGLYIGSIPDESTMVLAQKEGGINGEEPFGVTPFGICLVLEDAIMGNENGNAETIPPDFLMCIPLNYPFLRLKKVA